MRKVANFYIVILTADRMYEKFCGFTRQWWWQLQELWSKIKCRKSNPLLLFSWCTRYISTFSRYAITDNTYVTLLLLITHSFSFPFWFLDLYFYSMLWTLLKCILHIHRFCSWKGNARIIFSCFAGYKIASFTSIIFRPI